MGVAGAGAAEGGPGVVSAGALVGRQRELEVLRAALGDAIAGRGRLALVSGEPGIGKSRLVDEIGATAHGLGARVLWGRCWEAGGAPAYWPWLQSMRSYVRNVDEASLRAQLGPVAGDLAQVLPELSPLVPPGWEALPIADPEAARFRLFDAVASFLANAAEQAPIVLILDDLHAADAPSLLLLRFLATQVGRSAMLVVGAYRDVEVGRGHPLAEALPELGRHPETRRVRLDGLDRPDVGRFVRAVTGAEPSDAAIDAIHRETEGNPLFVGEVARLAAAEGRLRESDPAYWERSVPEGVREVIGRRVDRLSKECSRTLSLASVVGREFGLDVLEAMSGLDLDEIDEVLDEAAEARVVGEVPEVPGRLRFAHALIRDTLYDDLPPSRRARLHLRAAEVLRDVYGGESDAHAAELAHHYFRAGLAADATVVVDHARRAADRALALLAYEEAVRLYRMALTALERVQPTDRVARSDLQLALGTAWARAGDLTEGRRHYLEAAALARELGRHDVLAAAALGYGGRFLWPRAGSDPHILPLLEEALEALGDAQPEIRIRLMARLAGAMRDQPDRGPRDRLSGEAVALARSTGEASSLAYALTGRWAAMLGPVFADGRENDPTELRRAVTAAGDPELRFEGRLHELLDRLASGDGVGAHRLLEEMAQIADSLHQPAQQWAVAAARATFAILEGRFEEAEALTEEAAGHGQRAQSWDAVVFARLQRFVLRREQGRLDGLRDQILAAVRECPTRPIFRCMLAVLAAEAGDTAHARVLLDELAHDDFAAVPVNNDWTLSTALLAEVVAAVGDPAHADALYRVIRPAAGSCVDTLEVSTGSMDRYLGMLAAMLGRLDEAVAHLETAVDVNDRLDARPWAAHARVDLAAVLRRRRGPGDADRAAALEAAARTEAEELGIARLSHAVADPGSDTPAPPAPGPTGGTFRREGDYWLVAVGERHVRVQDSKGMQHLAALLQQPGRDVHALDLAVPGSPLRAAAAGDAGEILDAEARAAYRRRIEELQADLEEAESWHDQGRADAARAELDFLLDELSAATGLGGRARRTASDAERARVNVTRAIRSAVARIGEHDAWLGDELARTVRTGTFCRYEPDARAPVRWRS